MRRKMNRITLLPDGTTALLHLTRGQDALIDVTDLPRIRSYCWVALWSGRHGFRVVTRVPGGGPYTYLAPFLLGARVDHVNRNPLDNRRANLRPATQSQNMMNRAGWGKRSRYSGVVPTPHGRWYAKIVQAGQQYVSPRFDTQEEAARWYNAKAKALHGPFAVINTVVQGEGCLL